MPRACRGPFEAPWAAREATLGAASQQTRTTVTEHGPSATTREDTLPR